jgi:hypothetical protein
MHSKHHTAAYGDARSRADRVFGITSRLIHALLAVLPHGEQRRFMKRLYAELEAISLEIKRQRPS